MGRVRKRLEYGRILSCHEAALFQNNENVKDIFKASLEPFADMGATGITKSNTGSTDHLPFDAVGIPGLQFIQDELEYETRTHHSNMDTYDHLSIEDLQ